VWNFKAECLMALLMLIFATCAEVTTGWRWEGLDDPMQVFCDARCTCDENGNPLPPAADDDDAGPSPDDDDGAVIIDVPGKGGPSGVDAQAIERSTCASLAQTYMDLTADPE
jgi:hypothetical protein